MENTVLKIVYTFFLGIILALFVGLGIQTFYPAPEYPTSIEAPVPDKGEPTQADQQKDAEFQQQQEAAFREYEEKSEIYNRNVSTIALVAAVAFLGLSLLLEKRNLVLANGVMLGGLFTLLYSFGRGLISGNTAMTFIAVCVGLVVVLFLGYRRFLQPHGAVQPASSEKPPVP